MMKRGLLMFVLSGLASLLWILAIKFLVMEIGSWK